MTDDSVPDEAAVVLAALRRDTNATEPITAGSSAGFGEFLTQMSNLLAGLANAHLYPRQPLATRFQRFDTDLPGGSVMSGF